jgi:hypothetical protein
MVSKRRLGGRGNIAHLLTNRVHFACFARVQSFGWDSRKSPDASDYRCLWIGIRKTPYGVRIPVGRPNAQCRKGPDELAARRSRTRTGFQLMAADTAVIRACSASNRSPSEESRS